MSALLKFNYGVLAGLKNVTASAATAGNVYITQDERAMYVDIPVVNSDTGVLTGANRIRIGDMRVYNYLEDLQAELIDASVLTESALYYVEKKGKGTQSEVIVNALFKWSGSAGKFIQINDTASLVNSLSALEGKVTTLEGTVAGHITEINSINQNIGTINKNIEDITKESGIIDTKVAASAETLTGLINGKVSQGEFNTLNTTVTDHIAAQTTKDNAQDELIQKNIDDIGKNAEDIQDIRDTIESLTGTEGGSIGEQIDAKIQASEAKQAEKDAAQDLLISTNGTNIADLTTNLSAYKETVSNTYATKEELTSHYNAAEAKYATKEELTAHNTAAEAKYATKEELAGEVTRATAIEQNHEERIAEMEIFWKGTETPTDVIDTLDEIISYIESDKSGATEMLNKINKNTDDIENLSEAVGSKTFTDSEGVEVPATGLCKEVEELQTGLATEITDRASEISRIETYINEKLTWGIF